MLAWVWGGLQELGGSKYPTCRSLRHSLGSEHGVWPPEKARSSHKGGDRVGKGGGWCEKLEVA